MRLMRTTRRIYGVGYNTRGEHKAWIRGKTTRVYGIWYHMMARCYCPVRQAKQSTYIDCEVCIDWLDFQEFAEWYKNHEFYGKGYDLDKDILFKGNKEYSPETCTLVPQELNKLLIDCGGARGDLPQGVYLSKMDGKYVANMKIKGVQKRLASCDCPQEAHMIYKTAKESHVKDMANEYRDRITVATYEALMRWELD